MRRAQAGESGQDEYALIRIGLASEDARLAGVRDDPYPSRSHCTVAPAEKIEPSSA
jgi:hypothetical protein